MNGRPDRSGPPAAGRSPRPVSPRWFSRQLANGLRVEISTRTRTPDVALRLVVEAGAGTTAPELSGLAMLAGGLLVEGAGGRSSKDMAEWLDEMGAAFGCLTSYDSAVLSMHTLSDQFANSLEFLAAVTRAPNFDEREVDRIRGLQLDRIRRRADEPAEVAATRLAGAVFGVHPYGVPLSGTLESVSSFQKRDLAGFWAEHVCPSTATLVICGNVEPEQAFDEVERQFGDWGHCSTTVRPTPTVKNRPARSGEVLLVDRVASKQTELRVAGIGLARGASDEVPALMMNAILGGLFNSRINLNLREDKGWTYGARTTFVRRRAAGPFVLSTAIDTDVTTRAAEQIFLEFEAMRDSRPTDLELSLAANALTLSLPLQFETASQIAGRRVEAVSYGLPDDYWETFPDAVSAVTAGEVREAARRYLKPENLVLLAVGDVAKFAEELGRFGTVQVLPADIQEQAPM
jgi:zinc protease